MKIGDSHGPFGPSPFTTLKKKKEPFTRVNHQISF